MVTFLINGWFPLTLEIFLYNLYYKKQKKQNKHLLKILDRVGNTDILLSAL